ncbi:nucleotide pyrophosphohydrolase [Sporosarcina pasteurii]|uniref:MazG nucleotide pyrophosphohydrolase domain n=1 Tax=Sporosarcina pasteurii TaxID=1474 RepID=A0A380CH95_SPOPA|nr:nucleotide pyrophosphohydrolase [Sporosarcina pasteurii]MDS9472123.1 nucleotide pyrophosphohydrolase [Sporosarcina pasteurii]QBQ06838.1 nucleotide pyrophosphohydrolase [Sporosarcina pasteurii]SUJ20555.1 MazG nucleotide pyrophosphohydrolase domain [Sporosarcina pasteurii]
MKDLQNEIVNFTEERGWTGNKDARNLAISISLEANELLEYFQWNNAKEAITKNKDEIAEEAADVYIYLLQFAAALGIDLETEARKKMEKIAIRFPVK